MANTKNVQNWEKFWLKKQNKIFDSLKISLTKKVVNFLKSKAKNGKILDVGCGESLTSKYLKKGYYTVGIDFSDAACKLARKNTDKVVKGDIFKMPFKKNEFDIVFNQSVIHTVDKPLLLLKEMSRVTKRPGMIILTVPKRFSLIHIENKLSKLMGKSSIWDVHQHFYSRKELAKLVASLKFNFKVKSLWYNQLYVVMIYKK